MKGTYLPVIPASCAGIHSSGAWAAQATHNMRSVLATAGWIPALTSFGRDDDLSDRDDDVRCWTLPTRRGTVIGLKRSEPGPSPHKRRRPRHEGELNEQVDDGGADAGLAGRLRLGCAGRRDAGPRDEEQGAGRGDRPGLSALLL